MLHKFNDLIASNAIVLILYLSILLLCNLDFFNEKYLVYIYFPFGIIVLGYVFFGNKVIFAFILGHIIYYYLCMTFNINSYFSAVTPPDIELASNLNATSSCLDYFFANLILLNSFISLFVTSISVIFSSFSD